jgi:Lrp/AsnC family leucine-responsive transcriptional regulator
MTPPKLDEFDRAILEIVQLDNTTPQHMIGKAVNLSPAAVQRRIKRMEKAGVIQHNVSVVDPTAVGAWITLIVNVEVESERADLTDAIKQSFLGNPEVQQCYYVTGDIDFILIITVPDMGHYEALSRRLFFDNPNVKRFRTFVVMNRVKVGLYVPTNRRPSPE